MQRYIALLRAINVGGHTVKMDHLRKLFEALGFSGVETFIASGNVIFEAAEAAPVLEKVIEGHLKESLGYEVATFIRTPAEVAAVAGYQPFAAEELAAEGAVLYVAFLRDEPSAERREKLMQFRGPADDFHVHGREAYWLSCGGQYESRFSGAVLEKTLGMQATMRNVTTVRKLAAKYV